jgi:hypothetical protein
MLRNAGTMKVAYSQGKNDMTGDEYDISINTRLATTRRSAIG